ncbi:Gfo/Idh/MocA family protein [Luteococcus sp. Sow4_B9]|uniref:Gfo/Idh/MocA family protein n=1 Tax=Luteococcus sp. Sow4_B9 TaxID=3438792 RepID=UPI003F9CCB3B
MLNFASVGTSSIVELFGTAASLVDEVAWVAACSRDEARAASVGGPHGARPVIGLEALAQAPDVDAVYIASPNALHHEQAQMMLEAGKHVLLEKSACVTAEQWRGLVSMAQARGLVLLESVRAVHEPLWRSVTAHMDSLGEVRQVNLQMCQRSRRYDNYLSGRVENIFRPEMGAGALMDLGVYALHPLTTLFGLPTRVQSSSVKLSNGIDGATTLLLDYPGFTATIACSKVSGNAGGSVIAGEDASLLLDRIDDPHRLQIVWNQGGGTEEVPLDKSLPQQAHVLRSFARMVADPRLALIHQQATDDALTVMDEARRQVGLVLPGDPEWGI